MDEYDRFARLVQKSMWIIRSCWTSCPFRTEYRVVRSTGCNPSSSVVHRRFITVVRSQGVLNCDLELPRDQYWARSCTSCTQQMSRNLWNRSVLKSISTPTTPSFTIRAGRQMLQYWQPVLCASSRPWGTGCRRTGSDWTQTRHSSSGSEQAISWTFFRSIPYPQMTLSTTWEFTLILNYSWSARWTSSAKSATFICDVWERFAGR